MDPRLHALARETFRRLRGRVVLAAPVGIGTPTALVNAFYGVARDDPSVSLHILTALSLLRPVPSSELERRLAGPVMERIFRDCPDPEYARDLFRDELPANVRVTSFYYAPGAALGSRTAQQAHTSVNYTRVVENLVREGVNCLCQRVAAPRGPEEEGASREAGGPDRPLSLASNPDLTLDLLPHLRARRDRGEAVALLAQVTHALPFMFGDAVVPRDAFDEVVDEDDLQPTLFAPPSEPVPVADWSLGLHASALVRDGGTLQLGIGALGDAVSRLLILRHQENPRYRGLLRAGGVLDRYAPVVAAVGGTGPFEEGLLGSSEMLTQGLLELLLADVVRRPDERGHHLNACFFLGPTGFYEALRAMPPRERRRISMTRISEVNRLLGDEERKRRERRHARFLNSGMVATLLGAVASDGLEDGRVVSGVGGQHDFVTMAHELEGGRSILLIRSVREKGGDRSSNVRFTYGHVTIPRHLRDVVVTEYGIADLRGCSDEDAVRRMVSVADSRFQEELLEEAREAGKVDPEWEIPERHRANLPERLRDELGSACADGTLPEYPFGTELTEVEQGLARALRHLRRVRSGALHLPDFEDLRKTVSVPESAAPYLDRMGLADPEGLEEELMRRAVAYGLAAVDEV